MTEKRFTKTHSTINWWAVKDNGKELLEDEVVELLNALHEENEQLKQQNKELQGKASSWKITASEEMMKQSELMKENIEFRQKTINIFENGLKELFGDEYCIIEDIGDYE